MVWKTFQCSCRGAVSIREHILDPHVTSMNPDFPYHEILPVKLEQQQVNNRSHGSTITNDTTLTNGEKCSRICFAKSPLHRRLF